MKVVTKTKTSVAFLEGMKEIKALHGVRVLVGIPSSGDGRSGKGSIPSNATLYYLHENGNPSTNLPARPSLIPGVKATLPVAQQYFEQGLRKELTGNKGAMRKAMEIVGLIAVNNVKKIISDGIPPPITLRAKYTRLYRSGKLNSAVSAKRRATITKKYLSGTFTPLVDTAQMRNAITYVVRKK